jgi:SAM-dependent methyltransferase
MNDEGKFSKRRSNYNSLLGEQEFFVTPLLRKFIEESLESIGVPKEGPKVLDIGAGECPLREKLEQLGYRYLSLDIEQNSLRTIDYVARIDRTLPDLLISHGGFDLLILTEVLEHVPDWQTSFQNLAKLLKPGGYCIITTPFFYMLHEEPYDFWRPTDHALRSFAESNGLEVVLSRRNGDGWDVLGTLLCSTSVCRRRKNLFSYIPLIPAWILLHLAKLVFKSRIFQATLDFQMRYYLGNFLILRKK